MRKVSLSKSVLDYCSLQPKLVCLFLPSQATCSSDYVLCRSIMQHSVNIAFWVKKDIFAAFLHEPFSFVADVC